MYSERHAFGGHAASPPLLDKRYALGEQIGQGAFADVYAATHVFAGTEHAIKRWRIELGDSDEARWKREILAPRSIRHPAVVVVVDAGVDERHRPYAVMERLRGEDLETRLSRGPLTIEEALDVFEQLLDALAAAHAAGIVHRDLKPANVFLERALDGRHRVRLLDFGCALPLDLTITRITGSGVAVGTLSHMAPEQVMGAPDLGPTTDVWAAGVMIYQALAGRVPFAGRTIEAIITAICRGDTVPLGHAAPHVPQIIAAIVAKCLSLPAEHRYADARVLQQAWRAVRATRNAWRGELDASLDDAETKPLWSATAPPLPEQLRPARSEPRAYASPVSAAPAVIPATRPSQPAYAGPVHLEPSPTTPSSHPAFGADAGASADLRSGYYRRRRSRGALAALLVGMLLAATALFAMAMRDSLIVPALTGGWEYVGYSSYDRFWTPTVTRAAMALALASLVSWSAAAVLHRRRRR